MENEFKWTDDTVIDFVNWYIKLHRLSTKYELENLEILDSFKRGDKYSDWHKTNFNQIEDEN